MTDFFYSLWNCIRRDEYFAEWFLRTIMHWTCANNNKANLIWIAFKSSIFLPVRPGNLMDDIDKPQGTSFMPRQDFCIISKPLVNSNWSYSLEMPKTGSKSATFLSRVTLKFDGWTNGYLLYATSSSVHHFVANNEFELELQYGNVQFRYKSSIFFSHVGHWNLTDDLQ